MQLCPFSIFSQNMQERTFQYVKILTWPCCFPSWVFAVFCHRKVFDCPIPGRSRPKAQWLNDPVTEPFVQSLFHSAEDYLFLVKAKVGGLKADYCFFAFLTSKVFCCCCHYECEVSRENQSDHNFCKVQALCLLVSNLNFSLCFKFAYFS